MRAEDMAATNLLRIEGTANLIRASVAAGVQRIVGESFIYVYGYGDHGPVPKTEGDPPVAHSSDPGLQAVARALRSLERQLVTAAEQGQIEAIVPRFGLIYGPENRAAKHMVEMLRRRRLPLVRNAIGIASLIHVDDAVSATIAALERGVPGAIYNIVDDEPVPINAYIAAVARMAGAPRPYTIPRWLARLAAPAAYAGAMTRLPISNAKARRELGWQPRFPTFREGVPDLVERLSHANIGRPTGLLEGNAI
jgi:nucleoside-diphosphate-sugar epimerase